MHEYASSTRTPLAGKTERSAPTRGLCRPFFAEPSSRVAPRIMECLDTACYCHLLSEHTNVGTSARKAEGPFPVVVLARGSPRPPPLPVCRAESDSGGAGHQFRLDRRQLDLGVRGRCGHHDRPSTSTAGPNREGDLVRPPVYQCGDLHGLPSPRNSTTGEHA